MPSPLPTPSRHLADPVRQLDLALEARALEASLDPEDVAFTARTLAKLPGLRLVLLVLRAGARLREHRADADVSLQVLSGRATLEVLGEPLVLGPGGLATLARALPHELVAHVDTHLLLTLSGPRA